MSQIRLGIAEDNSELCNLLCAYLREQKDIEVAFLARDGLEAVAAVRKFLPQVLLLDILMPRLDGLGVLEELNGMELPTRPKTIVLSSFRRERIAQKAIGLGAEYYVTKPCSLSALHKRIRQLAEREEAEEEGRIAAAAARQNQYSGYEDLEVDVTNIICELGVPANMRGYQCLRDAIMLSVHNPDMLSAVTKELYPAVAKMNHTLPGRVEKNIRHAIETAWLRGRLETIDTIFGYAVRSDRGKPTNSEFIAIIADKLRLERKACWLSRRKGRKSEGTVPAERRGKNALLYPKESQRFVE